MKKRTALIFAAAGTAALAATLASHAYAYYWHHILPNRLFKRVRNTIASEQDITGGWINMSPDAGWQHDKLIATYRGGITTATTTFHFNVAEDGTLMDLTRD
ncbi:hypothetical protein [Lacticaseibacillus absianus]|uniref:hypothetical protein n=1 Tax=Lacticaseibacillus absianus TaxID=2729623 RepID=UPI0015C90A2C|nr:hypothetical protein [Lacticaseibacillus absianus]